MTKSRNIHIQGECRKCGKRTHSEPKEPIAFGLCRICSDELLVPLECSQCGEIREVRLAFVRRLTNKGKLKTTTCQTCKTYNYHRERGHKIKARTIVPPAPFLDETKFRVVRRTPETPVLSDPYQFARKRQAFAGTEGHRFGYEY